ncbi:MAG: 1,2-phenylacetyl-CoA epoxidase subunit PaaD [Duganella sp.]
MENASAELSVLSAATVSHWLSQIADPEIPAISITDLGIVRAVEMAADGVCHITITPTYSGCPAMQVIADAVTEALRARGLSRIVLHTQLTPAWTTDWMSDEGKQKLRAYGIAPPAEQAIDLSRLRDGGAVLAAVSRRALQAGAPAGAGAAAIACPHCGSTRTAVTSQFGSTPCKALYKCLQCSEPFDYFKCH